MKTVALQNLGCSKNLVDGEKIQQYLENSGFLPVDDFSKADIIVVNTCTFILEANQEAIASILDCARYKREGQCSTLVVSGCFSERFRDEASKQFPEVDLWVGVKTWIEELAAYFNSKATFDGITRKLRDPIETQYLKISDGCSHKCAFCIIPSVRGAFQSRTPR